MTSANTPEPHEAVHFSLEVVAQHCNDMTEPVYERFFAACDEAGPMMKHTDIHVRGRMLNDVLSLLMSPQEETDAVLLEFEVVSHRNYGVDPDHYGPFFRAIQDTTRHLAGPSWDETLESGWHRRIEELLDSIHLLQARLATYKPTSRHTGSPAVAARTARTATREGVCSSGDLSN